ncbi:hypothetical protein SAMN00777080_5087 [Aquiflexum balticum DSM 16537]|uniref:Uncharacterized protein n=1 Tax=Aquiflexum balticum DSM 16537 TaxID=758820 RepID=A0A1W2HCF6_9BACT|nr:hypothetical protein [Aquiflexum balticum]SMD46398.1 hypothetical protein SAMN00777080_5087 [Aquiflexum balticum DSM 16537]
MSVKVAEANATFNKSKMEEKTEIQKARQVKRTQLLMELLAKQNGQATDPTESILMQKLKEDFLSKNRQRIFLELMVQYLNLTTEKEQVSQVLTKFLNLTPQEQGTLQEILKEINK